MRVGEAGLDRAYLGENVVKEKEYLSAMIYVKAEICSRIAPEAGGGKGRLMEFKKFEESRRLSCCRLDVEVRVLSCL